MCEKASEILQKIVNNKSIDEVHFSFEDEKIRISAHKVILAGGSPVFKRLFFGAWRETGDIPIADVPVEIFEIFLETFYGLYESITMLNIYNLMALAHEYEASITMEYCETFLSKRLTARNVFIVLDRALQYNRNKLYKSCIDFLKREFSVFEVKGFSNCRREVLKRILLDLNHKDPYDTFLHCIRWAKKSCERKDIDSSITANLRKELGDCFELIQFSFMTRDQFRKIVSEYDKLFEQYEVEAVQQKHNI